MTDVSINKHDKHAGLNRHQFARDSLGTIFTKFILIGLKLGVSVITARFLGPQGKGIFYSSTLVTGTANMIGNLSLGESLIYMISRRKIPVRKIFGTVVFLTLLLTGIICCCLYLLLPLLKRTFLKDIPESYFLFIFLLVPLFTATYLVPSSLRALKRFGTANLLTIVTRGIILVVIVSALSIYNATAKTALVAFSLATAINFCLYFYFLYIHSEKNISISWTSIVPTIKYGGAMHLGIILNEMEYRIDIFLLLLFLSPTEVGIYSVSVAMAQILWYVTNSVNNVLFPRISSQTDNDISFFNHVLKYVLFANISIAILLVISGYPLVLILYGNDFLGAYPVFLVLLPGLIADVMSRTIISWIKGIGQPLLLSYVSAITLIANIGLNCLLIPKFGIMGAAVSSTLSYSLRSVILLSIFVKKTKSSIRPLFIFGKTEWLESKKLLFETFSIAVNKIKKGNSETR